MHLRRKHRYRGFGYKAYPDKYYFESLGVYEVPTKAPWSQPVNAFRSRKPESRIREN
jgi:hypothetical protein